MNVRNWNIAAAIDNPVALVRSMTRYESGKFRATSAA